MGRKLAVPDDAVAFKVTKTRAPRSKKGQANATKEFIAWDGEECRDTGYSLFGNSKGISVCRPNLGTEEMLACIIETGKQFPNRFHVGFAFYYDVNHILKDIGKLRIAILHRTKRVTWSGYTIEHIPHKIFTVSKFDAETGREISVRIDDCFTYFRQRFDAALIKYGIGTEEERAEVTKGKDARDQFYWHQMEDFIRPYWAKELVLLVDLMDLIRRDVNAAGFYIGQWHGPGALASYALREHGMARFKHKTPDEIMDAVMSAYSAGWFERFSAGYHDGPVYTADINSAYVYAISLLPDLSNGDWRHVWKPNPDGIHGTRFAVYHIRLDGGFSQFMATSHGIPMPLPVRQKDGVISHPVKADGWYWQPEAAIVAHNPNAEIVEAWIYQDDGTYPFEWVAKDYAHRLTLKRLGDPAEKIIKWMLASLYGRLAQRVGWNEDTGEPPAWHQLEWAGFITSCCRAMCYRVAIDVAVRDGLVSIDTDGVMSTVPFNPLTLGTGEGDALGQWKIESFSGLIYIQNGVYWLRNEDGSWEDPKLRGVDKDGLRRANIKLGPDEARKMLANGTKLKLTKKSFIGYGQALHTDWNRWRTWEEIPHEISVEYSGKRQHSHLTCRACRRGFSMDECLHDLSPLLPDTVVSQPHKLPWLDRKKRDHAWEVLKDAIGADEW